MNYKLKDIFKKPDIKMIALIGVLIAVEVLMHRLLSIKTPTIQLHFGFVPIVLVAMLYGPFYSGLAWAMADFIGTMLFPTGAFFPGFTLTAFLSGVIFGIFLFKAKMPVVSTVTAVIIINVFLTLILDMFWLYLITDQAFVVLIPERLMKCAVMIPLQIAVILLIKKYEPTLKKTSS